MHPGRMHIPPRPAPHLGNAGLELLRVEGMRCRRLGGAPRGMLGLHLVQPLTHLALVCDDAFELALCSS